jgi:hypothetical protein
MELVGDGCGFTVPDANCAATADKADTLTLQVPVPVQEPPQRRNREPRFAFGVSSTREPAAKVATHFRGQEIPSGLLATLPLPRMATLNVGFGATAPAPPSAPVAATAATAATPVPARRILVHVSDRTIRLLLER